MPSELLAFEGAAAVFIDSAAAGLGAAYARDALPDGVAPMAVLDVGGL